MLCVDRKCKVILSLTKKVWYLKVKYVFFFLMCLFVCIIAKPKYKSPSKLDKTFPFLCKPKTKCDRRGRKRDYFLLKAAAVFIFSL